MEKSKGFFTKYKTELIGFGCGITMFLGAFIGAKYGVYSSFKHNRINIVELYENGTAIPLVPLGKHYRKH